jgi:hypothetical protein
MASFSPRCEIRQLAVFVYPGGIKAPNAERITVFDGRPPRQAGQEAPLHPGSARSLLGPQAPVPAPRHRGGALSRQGLRPLAPVGLRAPGAFGRWLELITV